MPWDRTAGVIGPQGSGKTLDLLIPALLAAPGAALVTLTKTDDLLLSIDEPLQRRPARASCSTRSGSPPALPELVWDPIAGCVDPMVAERRAKAFTAGTVSGAGARGQGDDAARFYAAEAAKVIQAYFHAAALTGRTLRATCCAGSPTRSPPSNPPRSCANTRTPPRSGTGCCTGRCAGTTAPPATPSPPSSRPWACSSRSRSAAAASPARDARPPNIADVIDAGGTIYLLGRERPVRVRVTADDRRRRTRPGHRPRRGANASPWGRLCPPMLACLDELPSTAPLPTLRTRMANERALGISFIWAAQTCAQLTQIFGDHEARAVLGLTNTLVMFGGSKDVAFNQEISDLLGPVRVARTTWQTGRAGRSVTGEDIPILTGAEVRQLPERHALVVAENGKPIIARSPAASTARAGRRLLANQARGRTRTGRRRSDHQVHPDARATAALVEADRRGLRTNDPERRSHDRTSPTTGPEPRSRWSSPSRSPGALVEHAYWELPSPPTAPPEQKQRPRRPPHASPTLGPTHLHPPRPAARALGLARRRRHLDQPRIRLGHSRHTSPACWPEHPHLVHDLAVLADQRRRAGPAITSDALEDWHRYALPAFLDRHEHPAQDPLRERPPAFPLHQPPRSTQQRPPPSATRPTFDSDAALVRASQQEARDSTSLRLVDGELVDPATGEIHDQDD